MAEVIIGTDLSHYFKHLSRGKVRELYEIDDDRVLFVATDRVSAFDVVSRSIMLTGISFKSVPGSRKWHSR
jgi:phosphoribosylaminoimidazole-succinocarboxamide synthase